jgi:hypothetical protein
MSTQATAPSPTFDQRLAINGSRFAYAAAITWIALGVDSILRPFQVNARDTYWMLPFVLTMITFVYVHRVQRGDSRLERFSYYIVMLASSLVFLGSIGIQTNNKLLGSLGFPAGAILWTVGLIAFGVGTLRSKVLPSLAGWSLIVLEPLSILCGLALSPIAPLLERGAYSGAVEKGLVIALVGYALRRIK